MKPEFHNAESLKALRDFYKRELVENILPFWLKHARDRQCGGYHTCLTRDGSVYEYDKVCMWHAGRIVWTYSYLYNELEQNAEWLEMAQCGVDFVQQHGFAPDGSLYYALTRRGRPLEPPRDIFNDLSTAVGFTEFARATENEALYQQARDIFLRTWKRTQTPGQAFQPFIASTRPARLHGHSLIALGTLQELRRFRPEPDYEIMIDECIHLILDLHMKPEQRALFEWVQWNGDVIPGSRGRWICPGHMIEAGIFIIHEGRHRGDDRLLEAGVNLIDWGFQWGWDKAFGGITNDVDSAGLPEPTNDIFKHDAKLWWSHAEALYGLLLAHSITDDSRFLRAYRDTHEYSFTRFADPEHGEWFAYLDRRGNAIGHAKGSFRKSTLHIARNFYWCYRLLENMCASPSSAGDSL